MVVDKECRRPAVCCKSNTEYRQDLHQYSEHDFDMGRETRDARRGTRDDAGPPEKAKAKAGAWRLNHGLGGVGEKTTGANSRRSFATAANMREEFILSIKFIALIMVTHNSTLLGTLPPIPTNDSLLFESEHPLIPPRCFSASTLEANGWPIQSNGCSIQSFNFVPRSPPCVCCFSSPP